MAEGVVTGRPSTLPRMADPGRSMPEHPGARRDEIAAALRTLADESRRLERLGLSAALERCDQARRYWRFLDAMHAMVADAPRARGEW